MEYTTSPHTMFDGVMFLTGFRINQRETQIESPEDTLGRQPKETYESKSKIYSDRKTTESSEILLQPLWVIETNVRPLLHAYLDTWS